MWTSTLKKLQVLQFEHVIFLIDPFISVNIKLFGDANTKSMSGKCHFYGFCKFFSLADGILQIKNNDRQ